MAKSSPEMKGNGMIVDGIALNQFFVRPGDGLSINPEVCGRKLDLWGNRIPEVRDDLPVVVFLAEGSTLDDPRLAPDAQENFNRAVKAFARHGQQFCSVFRPEWVDLPILLWGHRPVSEQ